MTLNYKTISNAPTFLYKEKASKFYGFAFPVTTEDEVEKHLTALKKQFYDSRHICYAYTLGANKTKWRVNDAGEPANTAGKPILGQITAFDLTNVLVVVVRYFGGTKLGVGGLIQAYKNTAYETLLLAQTIVHDVTVQYCIECTYANLTYVLHELKRARATVINHVQHENNILIFNVPINTHQALLEKIERLVSKMDMQHE